MTIQVLSPAEKDPFKMVFMLNELAKGNRNGNPGTTTNDNAPPGDIGEYIESVVLIAGDVPLTSTTPVDVTTLPLAAGDWDVDTVASFDPAATTSITNLAVSISTVANTLDTTTPGRFYQLVQAAFVPNATQVQVALPSYRFSLAVPTTLHMVARGIFTVSTMGVHGIIRARRVR